MKLRTIIIIIAIIVILVMIGWFVVRYFSQQSNQSGTTGNDSTQGSLNDQNQGSLNTGNSAKKDLSLWYSDNDSTGSISYDLKNVSSDNTLDSYLSSLDSDVKNF